MMTTVLDLLVTTNWSGFFGIKQTEWIVASFPPSDLNVERHSKVFTCQTFSINGKNLSINSKKHYLDCTIRWCWYYLMSICTKYCFVDKTHMATEFFQLLARFESMNFNCSVEWSRKNLKIGLKSDTTNLDYLLSITWEEYRSNTLAMSSFKSSQTLSGGNFPNFNFSILGTRHKHFWITWEIHC